MTIEANASVESLAVEAMKSELVKSEPVKSEPVKIELVAIQLCSTTDIQANLIAVEQHLQTWQQSKITPTTSAETTKTQTLVVLPECFACFSGIHGENLDCQETLGDDTAPIQQRLKYLAIHFGVWLVAGTMATRSPQPERFYATALVLNPKGELIADYQKIHLFDVDVTDGMGSYRESDTTYPGERVVIFQLEGITVGLAVCYDVRFPGLFTALRHKGADVVVLPSAFTVPTGKAHWHSLLRARAIENQIYLVAAAQDGEHLNNRVTFGHSMIVDPWGDILAELEHDQGFVCAPFNPAVLCKVRGKMPLQQHNRFKNELIDESNSRA